jgi:AcrR family transcriptional regulator
MKASVSTPSRAGAAAAKPSADGVPPADGVPAARPAGRPRDPRLDASVLATTRRLLRRVGYNRLSIGAIARDAGIHRPAIYRRWRSKAELVHEAVYPAGDESRRIRDTGDIARDLRARVRFTVGLYTRPEVLAALPGLMADYRDDPGLQRKLVARIGASARADFARMIADAKRRGDVDPAVRAEVLFDALSGTIIFRIMMSGVAAIRDLEDELTHLLLVGAGAAPRRQRRSPARRIAPAAAPRRER